MIRFFLGVILGFYLATTWGQGHGSKIQDKIHSLSDR